ncbi:hypothetical protein [Bradyrhizobium genosp. P]|uniref:hypothetical protein n=1 Tax=Bradyrhizobium genosp. P TaxID=83641 RepID=UPI003CEAA710
MKNVRSYRASSARCRQQAALRPEEGWKWLSEAERWERLAEAEIASHFEECNTNKTINLAQADAA